MAGIVIKQFSTVVEAVKATNLGASDIVQTLGWATVGKGAGYYKLTSVYPGYVGTINHVTQSMVNTAPLYLKLLHEGTISIEQAGARGDGNIALSGIGTDDTNAIQACLNMLMSGNESSSGVCHVTAGEGVFNFTTIRFYDPSANANVRGDFRFTGAGNANPGRLRAGVLSGGTVFKCISPTGSFDINTAIITDGKLDLGSSMSAIDIGHFSIVGAVIITEAGDISKLVSTDLVVSHSLIHDISVVNIGDGIAWYTRSNFTTKFSNIQGIGKLNLPRKGKGFFYDTDYGVGSMAMLENMTFSEFVDGIYIGHTDAEVNQHGGFTGSILLSVQALNCTNNFHFGKLDKDSSESLGNRPVYMDTCYCGNIDGDGSGILLEYDASITVVNSTFGGLSSGTVQAIRIDNTNSVADSISSGGKIILDNCRISVTPGMEVFCVVPSESYYSIHTRNTTGRTYNKQIFSLPSVFKGVFLSQDDAIEGMAVTQTLLVDKLQYLHPASRIKGMENLYLVAGTDVDLSNRPYLPQSIEFKALATGAATSTIIVPNLTSASQIDQHSRCTIRTSTGSFTLKLLSATANMKINNLALTAQITITAANQFYEIIAIDTNDGIFYQVTSADTTATVL